MLSIPLPRDNSTSSERPHSSSELARRAVFPHRALQPDTLCIAHKKVCQFGSVVLRELVACVGFVRLSAPSASSGLTPCDDLLRADPTPWNGRMLVRIRRTSRAMTPESRQLCRDSVGIEIMDAAYIAMRLEVAANRNVRAPGSAGVSSCAQFAATVNPFAWLRALD
jgi:hypothetical protein